ncbi:DNA polymerase domain-containing protein [Clostridium botulinum]|uniref:DNA polymerase domain-containing protein n=1 Tax=Clostridium botulinum TaxID=1491 RepID=UPI0004B06A6C|nr:DNA polymerase domain-containing protein [Clostridium botulinum]APQ71658.1 DNA polymerase B family protein [Clostridium botulinum]
MILNEVFKHDWLVVIKDTDTKKTHTIVNNVEELRNFYETNKDNIWCGYNSRSYDQWVLKAIIAGFNPKELNDWIIVEHKPAWKFSSTLFKIQLYNYDVMTSFHGLKQLEGFMGNDIRETTVSFDIDRKLTEEELQEVIFYCNHDVEQTMEVFINRIEEFEAHMGLIKNFKLPLKYISKTKAQLSAIILGANKQDREDEFEISIVDTIKINKYREILNWYKNPLNRDYKKSLEIEVAGVPHIFGWGGLHGARDKYQDEGIFINSDVGSFYPSLMIQYDFLSRNVRDKSKYKEIYDYRMQLKREGKKKEQQPYKIVLNSTYGASKDKYNNLFDPLQANNVCVNGQLMLLDLIEKVIEGVPGAKLIQSNTDGVMWKLENKLDVEVYKKICDEWCNRTRMTLDHDHIKKVVQKDVNSYLIVMENGKIKSKGAYVKALNKLDYDLPIVNKALMEYFIDGITPEETINNCNQLKEFQKVVKISSKYLYGFHGNEKLDERVLRVFASRSRSDAGVFKVKTVGGTKEKIASTPIRCFIDNSDIEGKKVPHKLDKQWYIDVAWKRMKDFIG